MCSMAGIGGKVLTIQEANEKLDIMGLTISDFSQEITEAKAI